MKKRQRTDWMIGSLRTLAALAGVLLLVFGAAPGALAAGTQQAAQVPAGETGTVIWGVVFALAALGLCEEDWSKPARQLSGGQARRVALARAVLAPAEGVILDEPFKGLDEETRQRAMDWVRRMLKGRWLLLITHDEQEAEAFGGARVEIS